MTPDPETLTPDAEVKTAAERMRDLHVGLIPVVSDATELHLVRVITDRGIAVRHEAEGHDPTGCTVATR